MKKRVLLGSVLNNNPKTLSAFFQALSQIKPETNQIAFAFIGVRLTPLSQHLVRLFLFRHPGFVEKHYIQKEALSTIPKQYMGDWHFALSRNRLIQEAIESNADAALLLEVDTPIKPETLSELLSTERPWVDKLVFDGDQPLASPTVAQPMEDIDPHFFDGHEYGLIASAGSCMLLQGEALSPLLRYQYLPTLGLPRPDQHLAIRAMNTDFDRIIDTRNPLQKNPTPHPEPGALDWLTEGVSALLSYTPNSTGQEGSSYLCQTLREQRLSDAPQLAKELQAAQTHSRVYVVSAEPDAEREGHYTIYAIQELESGSLVEHHCLVIELSTTVENNHQTINGIDFSTVLESELPAVQDTKKQRYAIPPIGAVFQKNEADNHANPVDVQSVKSLVKSIQGLQVYRLPR